MSWGGDHICIFIAWALDKDSYTHPWRRSSASRAAGLQTLLRLVQALRQVPGTQAVQRGEVSTMWRFP